MVWPRIRSQDSVLAGRAEGFVLAGGRSSRMGQDKALLQVAGRSLLEVALEKLRCLDGPAPRIAAARSDLLSHAPVIPDLHPGCGPLSGIEAALAATTRPLNRFSSIGYATVARTAPQLDAGARRDYRRPGDHSPHPTAGPSRFVPSTTGICWNTSPHLCWAATTKFCPRSPRPQANRMPSISSTLNYWLRPILSCPAFPPCRSTAGFTTATRPKIWQGWKML